MSCSVSEDLDLSNYPYPGEIEILPIWEVTLKVVFCTVINIVALLGNAVVITIVLRTKKMHTTTNYYIMNLACSDILVGLGPIWIHLVTDVTHGWQLGGFLCKFNAFLQVLGMCASVFTLIAIACDRFFAIIFPLQSRFTQRRLKLVVISIWACAIIMATPLIIMYQYQERKWKDKLERFCTDIWPVTPGEITNCGRTSKRAFWTVLCVLLNWIPMFVMGIAYSVILYRLRSSSNVIVPSGTSQSMAQHSSRRNVSGKVVSMLLSVLIVFIVCTVPFQVTKFYDLYREDSYARLPDWYQPVYFAAITLMYANSAINPILYAGLNDNFRDGFRLLVGRRSARHPDASVDHEGNHVEMGARAVSIVSNTLAQPGIGRKMYPSTDESYVSDNVISIPDWNTDLTGEGI